MSSSDLSCKQVADELGVSDDSVREWVRQGLFPGSWQRGGVIRIPRASLDHFRAEHAISVPRGTDPDPVRNDR